MVPAVGDAGTDVMGVRRWALGVWDLSPGRKVPNAQRPKPNASFTRNTSLTATPDPPLTIAVMRRILLIALFALTSLSVRADLPFIENDYTKAIAQARAKNVPLFVEAWAPW